MPVSQLCKGHVLDIAFEFIALVPDLTQIMPNSTLPCAFGSTKN